MACIAIPCSSTKRWRWAACWSCCCGGLKKRDPFWLANGFYLVVGWYGLQRFVWEFIKPYATFAGPFNVFHLVCLASSYTLPR